jgi:retinol dehydrogenase 12
MIILATYISRHYADDGVLAFSLNPGIIQSGLARHSGAITKWVASVMFSPTPMGAINQLYAGTSPVLTSADSGKYFIPWAQEGKMGKGVQAPELADKLWKFLENDIQGKY